MAETPDPLTLTTAKCQMPNAKKIMAEACAVRVLIVGILSNNEISILQKCERMLKNDANSIPGVVQNWKYRSSCP